MHNQVTPLVSIISVNYNGFVYTERCLESLMKLKYPSVEIIVLDNGSTQKEDWKSLEKRFPGVRWMYSEENLGFAGGNNLAIREASGEYIWLLNNDTEVEPDALDHLVETMKSDDRIGMCSSRILYFEPRGLVQYAGMTDLNRITMRNRSIGYREEMQNSFLEVGPTAFIHGASVLVRRSAVDEVGLMREVYFLYYEEYDWCWRMRRAGYRIYYDGRAVVYHKESAVTGPDSPLKTYYLFRNRILFARLNFGSIQRIASVLFTVFVAGTKAALSGLLKGRYDQVKSLWRALIWNFQPLKKARI